MDILKGQFSSDKFSGNKKTRRSRLLLGGFLASLWLAGLVGWIGLVSFRVVVGLELYPAFSILGVEVALHRRITVALLAAHAAALEKPSLAAAIFSSHLLDYAPQAIDRMGRFKAHVERYFFPAPAMTATLVEKRPLQIFP